MEDTVQGGQRCRVLADRVYEITHQLARASQEEAERLSFDDMGTVLADMANALGYLSSVQKSLGGELERRRQATGDREVSEALDTVTVHLAYAGEALGPALHLANQTSVALYADPLKS